MYRLVRRCLIFFSRADFELGSNCPSPLPEAVLAHVWLVSYKLGSAELEKPSAKYQRAWAEGQGQGRVWALHQNGAAGGRPARRGPLLTPPELHALAWRPLLLSGGLAWGGQQLRRNFCSKNSRTRLRDPLGPEAGEHCSHASLPLQGLAWEGAPQTEPAMEQGPRLRQ